MTDPSDDLLADLIDVGAMLGRRTTQLSAISHSLYTLQFWESSPAGRITDLRKVTAAFRTAVIPRVQDIELVATSAYVQRSFGGNLFPPTQFNQSGSSITVSATDQAQLDFRSYWLLPSSPDEFSIQLTLSLTVSGNAPVATLMFLLCQLVINSDGSLGVRLSARPRFYQSTNDLEETDPLGDLPLDVRKDFRVKVRDQVVNSLGAVRIVIPSTMLAGLGLTFRPLDVLLYGELAVFAKSIERGRAPEQIAASASYGFDRMLRLHRQHIIPIIEQSIRQQQATPDKVSFQYGYIYVRAIREDHLSECALFWKVEINYRVVVEYVIRPENLTPLTVVWRNNLMTYSIHVELKNVPFFVNADDAARSVRDYIESQIKATDKVETPLGINTIGLSRVSCFVHQEGVDISVQS